MPKILTSVREQLLGTARAQILEQGYAKTTMRSIAAACGIAVGTVYNYFPSKDMLIATFVAEDWQEFLDAMRADDSKDPGKHFKLIYDSLTAFAEKNAKLFSDKDAAAVFSASLPERHGMLRAQIAEVVLPYCGRGMADTAADPAFLADFIAESILTWSMAKVPFEKIYSVIEKIILPK